MLDSLAQSTRELFLNEKGVVDRALAVARLSCLCFLAASPFPHNAALKNAALAGMLATGVWLLAKRRLEIDWRSPILRIFAGLLLVLGVGAALGSEPADSFNELRKHFLPGALLLLLIPSTFRGPRLMHLALGTIAVAFMLRTGLTLAELAHYFPDVDAGRSEGRFIKGYSLDTSLYMPALVGLMLLGGRWRWIALLGLLAMTLAMLLTQSRTPVLAMLIAIVSVLLLLRRWRVLMGGALVVMALGAYLAIFQAQVASRFGSTFDPQTYARAFDTRHYQATEGFAVRIPIWAGVMEIAADRWLVGYGFGWKKLGRTAVEAGYVGRWKARENDAFAQEQASYFSAPTSKVNPHSLYLQIYFESGLIGLAAYAAMLVVLFRQTVRLVGEGRGIAGCHVVASAVLAYLVGHVVLGLTNGLWIGLGPSLALIALLETLRSTGRSA